MSAQEENEIREAFSLFAEAMDGEKHGVLPTGDVKSAMMCVKCVLGRRGAEMC